MLYRPNKDRKGITVDLSPLIDVVFLLLIFFMVSTQFKDDAGVDLNLPEAESQVEAKEEDTLTVSIDREKVIRIGEEETPLAEVRGKVSSILQTSGQNAVVFKVDEGVEHGMVMSVVDAARLGGATEITFSAKSKPKR